MKPRWKLVFNRVNECLRWIVKTVKKKNFKISQFKYSSELKYKRGFCSSE